MLRSCRSCGARVVSSVKLALQPDRDVGHIPGGDAPNDQVPPGKRTWHRRGLLDAVTIAVEPDRVKVNPPAGTTGHLQGHGKSVGLCREPHRLERSTSHPKCVGVDRQVEVAVLAGRFTVERVDSPASGESVADAHTLEGVEDLKHLAGSHEA